MSPIGRVIVLDVGVEAPRLAPQLTTSNVPVSYIRAGAWSELVDVLGHDAGIAIVASDTDVSGPALDDVLADPRPTTRLLVDVAARSADTVPSGSVTTAGRRVTAAATAAHATVAADGRNVGALALAVQDLPAARAAAEDARRYAATTPGLDSFDLFVTALVRHGVTVTTVPVQPLLGRRLGRAAAAHSAALVTTDPAQLSPQEETDRRWRAASRADDGFFSTFAIRPMSRRLSRRLGARGWTPNRVTLVSAMIGLAAAAGFATGATLGLVIGALALQASLVFDCSDGEIARFTRGYTAAGAWLDAATDRVKEYLALAGLAVGAARSGEDIWLLATAAMAVQTVRHLQDFAFVRTVLAQWRSPVVDRRSLTETVADPNVTSGGEAVGETVLDAAASRRQHLVFWLKRIIHLPIAERWLLMSVGALIGDPWLAIVLYLGADVAAWAWTTLGWLRRSLRSAAGVSAESADVLRRYRDDGPLGHLVPRSHSASRRRAFAWVGPPLVTTLEFAAVILTTALVASDHAAWAFGWVAAVAWHRYDVVYRWRDWREPPSGVVTAAMLGWPIRSAVMIVAAIVATATEPELLAIVLVAGTAWFGLVGLIALVPVVRRLAPEPTDTPA